MKNEVGSSRMDTILKMLMIAFVSLLAFSSGVYFGKKLSDSDYQLKALESDFQNSATTAANGEEGASESALNPEEVAALSEKLVDAEKSASTEASKSPGKEHEDAASSEHDSHHVASTHAPASAESAAPAHTKPDLSSAERAAQRLAQGAAPVEATKAPPPSRIPSSLPKVVGHAQEVEFTVQVASYPTAEAAKEHAADLVSRGFPAFPVEANISGKVWYRVSVGSFKTQREATEYRAQLMKQASLPSAIVQKIQR